MTTIHMDVDAARNVQHELERLHDSIQRIVNSTNTTVSSLPSNWRSEATNQFMAEYQDSMGEISGILGRLQEAISGISSAIADYERMADRLGD
jgi:uncharacterized protein YukE